MRALAKNQGGGAAPAVEVPQPAERPGQPVRRGPANPRPIPAVRAPADPAALLADLDQGNDGVRAAALDRLARLAPDPAFHDAVIHAIGPFLAAASPDLRAAAVKALGAWANADDVPALIGPLDDGEPAVRRQALAALGRFPDARAVPPVARHLADPDPRAQSEAVRALRQMGSIAEREVARYLEAGDIRLRERACQVLQAIGTRDSILALNRAAAGRTTASRAAQAALRAIEARDRRR
jgi:HEAT repeat protein